MTSCRRRSFRSVVRANPHVVLGALSDMPVPAYSSHPFRALPQERTSLEAAKATDATSSARAATRARSKDERLTGRPYRSVLSGSYSSYKIPSTIESTTSRFGHPKCDSSAISMKPMSGKQKPG